MRFKNNFKKVLTAVMSLGMVFCMNMPVHSEDAVFTDVKIEYTAPVQVNTKLCVGETVSGGYTYNSNSVEQDTQYRWIYSDTIDFTSYDLLQSGTTTASTVSEDTKITIGNKLLGKYLAFEVLANGGEVSVKSQPLYIISKNLPTADYALITSEKKDENASTTATNFLSVRNNAAAKRITLLKFNLEDCEEVKSAVLSLTIKDVYEQRTLLVFPAGNGWSKSSTWNNLDWSQIGGSEKGDVSALSGSNELLRITNLTANTNCVEMDLTDYINSQLKKGSTSISVAFFALQNDAGVAIRPPSRPNDAPYLQVCVEKPLVSAADAMITDAEGKASVEALKGDKLTASYTYEGEKEEGESFYRWLYAKDKDSDVWFTYKQGTTIQATAETDTQITVDKILCGNYVRFEITPVSTDGETGKSVFSEDITIMSSKLVPLAAASIKENDKDTSVGMSANSFHARMDAEGNRRATLLRYSLEGLEYPVENAELRYYMYYSSGAGEHVLYDIGGGWDDGVTLSEYGPITSVFEGKEIGRVEHSGTANQNINPPQKLSVDFTDYINDALMAGKKEINFAIWYAENSGTVVSFMRGPAHAEYPAQVLFTDKNTNISRSLDFSNNSKRILKLESGKIEITAEADLYDGVTMIAVLFDAQGNMLDLCADSGTDGFYAELDNTSGEGECAQVYFWNNLKELKEQTFVCNLTPEGIFEE